MTDRLAEVRRYIKNQGNVPFARLPTPSALWLADEVERLRDLLGRLEWAGTTCYDAYGAENTCPACRVQWDTAADFKGHADDCWLAAELQRRDPPDSPPPPEGE